MPRPLGRPPVVILPPSPRNAKGPPTGEPLHCLAGVEGFEPPNGGIKTRDCTEQNQQVIDSIEGLVPLNIPGTPIAATKPATRGWVNGGHPNPVHGTTTVLLLSAYPKRPAAL